MLNQYMHFSIDDVIWVFKKAYEKKPKSIFDMEFFKRLKKFHDTYGMDVTLYVYEKEGSFTLDQLPLEYWGEIRANQWIKFGWHREKGGLVSSSLDEVESIKRTYELFKRELNERQIDKVLCVHRYQVDQHLIDCVKKIGICTLLATEKDFLQEGIEPEQGRLLNATRECYTQGLYWRKRDLCFDTILSSEAVSSAIEYTKKLLEIFIKNEIEIFCHERFFLEVVEYIEQYMEEFESQNMRNLLRVSLYPNVASIIDGVLYFTTNRDKNIYSFDLRTNELKRFIQMPFESPNHMRFVAMHSYGQQLILIPNMDDAVWIVDVATKEYQKYIMPGEWWKKEPTWRCRKSIQQDNKIWFMLNTHPILYEFDVEKCSYHIYSNWPEGISFEKDKRCFMSMCLEDEYLYLFADNASCGIKFNTVSHDAELWALGIDKYYGIVNQNSLYCAPVKKNQKEFQVYSSQNCIDVDVVVKEQKINTEYYYWNPVKFSKKIFYAPFMENRLLIYDLEDTNLKSITLSPQKYRRIGQECMDYGAYDFLFWENKVVVVPFYSDTFLFVNTETEEIQERQISRQYNETLYESRQENFLNGRIALESPIYSITDILKEDKVKETHNEIGMIGALTYQMMRDY